MDSQYTPLINNMSKFVSLTEGEINLFCSFLSLKEVKKKDYLLRQGEVCHSNNFVIKGCFKAFDINDGEENITQFAIENWWLADVKSFTTQCPALFFIQALEDSAVIQLPYDKMEEVYQKIPKIERFFRIAFQISFANLQERIVKMNSLSGKERYKHFIATYPKIEQRVPQYMIGSYLGLTPVFLSNVRKEIARGN
ncbi:Crp/Fnr family transcriptional regulator [uncultured Aquimarina sp.]|uniref:Crp/Fnr family transcriptional regulator n=1 Tax=uncultured Aquimarina sp. TaxID=575652 RepID=UPI002631B20A|nr:Crp/Fnr family transcriptional regulator [uncultured Aquimarina sp.]